MSEKLFIGICNSQNQVPAEFFWSFTGMTKVCPIEIYRARHPWDIIRNNQIIDKFLKSDCTVLAKMDIDQAYPSSYIERFMSLVDKYKVIGPFIRDRASQVPLAFTYHDGEKLMPMDTTMCTGIVDVPYSHTNNFYAREVWENIPAPWYEAYLTEDGLHRKNHVDFTLLDKIHLAGYKTYVDFSIEVAHGV